MKGLKKETHPNQRTAHKQKTPICKPKPEKNTHTENLLNPKLHTKGHPPPRIKNQMTDKKDKKFSILLLLGGDMEQSPIQAFLHIGIGNTAIYLERKLGLTTTGKGEEQSSV